LLLAALLGLVGWSFGLAALSEGFAYGPPRPDKPTLAFVLLQAGAGLVYLAAVAALWALPCLRRRLGWWLLVVVLAGLGMRLGQFDATPVLETDQYRYLWDGALTAHGINPYLYAPQAVRDGEPTVPDAVRTLGERSGRVLARVNHPGLRTIYPPTAQGAFAVAHGIDPFDVRGLRWTWLGLDVLLGLTLWMLVRTGPEPLMRLGVYWLNPLLVKEVYNSGHMELILMAAAMGAVWAAVRLRPMLSAFLLALAAGAKVWPLLWLPLLLRHAAGGADRWRMRAAAATGLFGVTLGALAIPVLVGRLDGGSGFTAYAERWQMNDSAFMLIQDGLGWLTAAHAPLIARGVVGAIVLGVLGWCLCRARRTEAGLFGSLLAVTATLFLFSPTQFPWYYLWVLPVLALRPMGSLLLLTVLLPIYYLRFPMDAAGSTTAFDYGLVWLQFVPVWALLVLEGWYRRRRGDGPGTDSEPAEAASC